MEKFKTKQQLQQHLILNPYPEGIATDMLNEIKAIESLNAPEYAAWELTAYLVIAVSEQDKDQADKEFNVSTEIPEYTDEIIDGGETWIKSVFIFSDAGDGIVYYERAKFGEK